VSVGPFPMPGRTPHEDTIARFVGGSMDGREHPLPLGHWFLMDLDRTGGRFVRETYARIGRVDGVITYALEKVEDLDDSVRTIDARRARPADREPWRALTVHELGRLHPGACVTDARVLIRAGALAIKTAEGTVPIKLSGTRELRLLAAQLGFFADYIDHAEPELEEIAP